MQDYERVLYSCARESLYSVSPCESVPVRESPCSVSPCESVPLRGLTPRNKAFQFSETDEALTGFDDGIIENTIDFVFGHNFF